jgi:hypothetical protein
MLGHYRKLNGDTDFKFKIKIKNNRTKQYAQCYQVGSAEGKVGADYKVVLDNVYDLAKIIHIMAYNISGL